MLWSMCTSMFITLIVRKTVSGFWCTLGRKSTQVSTDEPPGVCLGALEGHSEISEGAISFRPFHETVVINKTLDTQFSNNYYNKNHFWLNYNYYFMRNLDLRFAFCSKPGLRL